MSFAAGGNDNRGDDVRKRKREADTNTGGSAGAKGRHNNNNNGDARTTLGSLLKYMEGYEVIVELKTGKRHRGRLASADDNMNLMLEDEKEEEEEQQQQQGGIEEAGNKSDGGSIDTNTNNNNNNNTPARQLFSMPVTRNIRGSKIRYVHFPDNANLPMLVRSGRERERNAANKYQKTKRTRK